MPARQGCSATRPRRPLVVAAAVYVIAWALGLVTAPAGPDMAAPAAEITAHFRINGGGAAMQSVLVHGLAGAALAVVVVGLVRRLPTTAASRVALITGLAGVAMSLAQVAFLQLLVATVDTASATDTARLFTAVNIADSIKLFTVGAFVAATAVTARRAEAMPGWLHRASLVLAVALPVSGSAFLIGSQALYALLYLTLPLLLGWVATTAVVVSRRI